MGLFIFGCRFLRSGLVEYSKLFPALLNEFSGSWETFAVVAIIVSKHGR
jgi:hypothetical protein